MLNKPREPAKSREGTDPDFAAQDRGLSPILGSVLALVAGACLPIGFEPYGLFPLALLAPAALFALWRGLSPMRALWRGWLFGLGMFAVGVSWIVESFQYSDIALSIAIPLTCLFIAFLALFPALLGFLTARFRAPNDTLHLLLLLPAAWVLAEWARGTFLTGFTWLQLGYSQVGSPLSGLAPIVGVYGISWCVALGAGLTVWVFGSARKRWWIGIVALAALWIGGAKLQSLEWTERAGLSLRVALIQGNVPQDVKWQPQARAPTLARYLELTRANWDADLVVWPETALPGRYESFDGFLAALEEEAVANRTDLLIGVPSAKGSPRRFFNSLVSVGSRRALYHKRHLVPFGEYLPLKPLLQPIVDLLQLPVSDFSPGPRTQALLRVAGQRVGVSICYESAFGAEIAEALPEATLLVNVSNDAWFGDTIAPHQHLQIARLRAIETGRYLLRATNTGISAIIGPRGGIIEQSPQFEVDAIAAVVLPMKGETPYSRMGDVPVLVGLVFALVVCGLFKSREPTF